MIVRWEAEADATVAIRPDVWYFVWLSSGRAGAGLIAHLALVAEDWRVVEGRCLALDARAESVLVRCGFRRWVDGPPTERHLLHLPVRDAVEYARSRS